MNNIPAICTITGDSSGRINQLSRAPNTGIRNFQIFNPDTFTPGRFSKMNQILNAAADIKLSQPRDI